MDFIVKSALEQDMGQKESLDFGQANIKVIGTGGAGNNMVSWLYKKGIRGAEVLACNTDKQHIDISEADKKFLKKIYYAWSLFNYIKCTDCHYDGMADPYCKPPLGLCIFEPKNAERFKE